MVLSVALALTLSVPVKAGQDPAELSRLQNAADLSAELKLDSPEQSAQSAWDIHRALVGEGGAPLARPRSMTAKGLPNVGGAFKRWGAALSNKADKLRHKIFVPPPHGVDREDSWAAKVAPAGRWIGVAVGVAAFIGAVSGVVTLPLYFAIPGAAFVLFGARPGMATAQAVSESALSKTAGFLGKLWDRMAR